MPEHMALMHGANDGSAWYADHTSWTWIMGLHGLSWLLVIFILVLVLAMLIRGLVRSGPDAPRPVDAETRPGRRSGV